MTDAVREYRETIAAIKHCEGDGFTMGKCADCPTGDAVCCTGEGPPTETRVLGAADAAIAELEAKVEELDDKLMEAEGAHDAARRWFEEQKKQFARAEQAEAERDRALFVADGWHRQFKHAAEVRRAERVRAEKAEAEARRWEWLAKEASLGRRTPDGPLLDTLLARYEEAHHA